MDGCIGIDSTVFNLYPNPEVELGENILACEDVPVELIAEILDVEYYWNGLQGEQSYISTDEESVTLLVIDSETGCSGTDKLFVERKSAPELSVTPFIQLCPEEILELPYNALGADSVMLFGSRIDELFIPEEGDYELTAVNECGFDFQTVSAELVNCLCNVYVPNTFTPNGDGLNDELFVRVDCDYTDFEFRIFNRWGDVLFETEDPTLPWLGANNGGEYFVPDGVYLYTLSYTSIIYDEIRIKEQFGHINVLR